MDDLIAFLRARLDETAERAPRTHLSECATTADWYYGGTSDCDCGEPARVLAEVDAKRLLLELHPKQEPGQYTPYPYCECQCPDGIVEGLWPCETVKILTLTYARHPGYREEWKP